MPELTPEKIALFDRLLAGKLLAGDAESLVEWLGTTQPDEATVSIIMEQLRRQPHAGEEIPEDVINRLEQRLPLILAAPQQNGILRTLGSRKWLRYAASLLILLAVGYGIQQFVTRNSSESRNEELAETIQLEDIVPGKDGAVLTLVDGSTVVLDSMGNGLVTTQNGTKVLLRNGQLVYDGKNVAAAAVGYNTMSTPKGRQFKLVLPDGTNVWLNAASSIRYPVVFNNNERVVDITGEAYFEVAHNKKQPFRVRTTGGTEIEVLGTHFNINSYDNEESVNTTLLEGSVRVLHNGGQLILKPGQQAQSTATGAINLRKQVNLEQVMAWKNGIFDFQDATLEEVMRQLERWYDIEVVYEKNIPKLEFYGKMGKDLSLESVLSGLEKSNVRFRLEAGRKLVVLP